MKFEHTYCAAVVSTAHITPTIDGWFRMDTSNPGYMRVSNADQLTYGYRFYIGDGEESIDWIPRHDPKWAPLRQIALEAHRQGFDYLVLDPDGLVVDGVETFEHLWTKEKAR